MYTSWKPSPGTGYSDAEWMGFLLQPKLQNLMALFYRHSADLNEALVKIVEAAGVYAG